MRVPVWLSLLGTASLAAGCSLILDFPHYRFADADAGREGSAVDAMPDHASADGFLVFDHSSPDIGPDAVAIDAEPNDVADAMDADLADHADLADASDASDADALDADLADASDASGAADVSDVVDAFVPPNIRLRYNGSGVAEAFLERSPFADPTHVNLTRVACVGGLRSVTITTPTPHSEVECLVPMPATGGRVRFNFAASAAPATPDDYLCNPRGCPMFPTAYTVNFNGLDVLPRTDYLFGSLPDSRELSTRFIEVILH